MTWAPPDTSDPPSDSPTAMAPTASQQAGRTPPGPNPTAALPNVGGLRHRAEVPMLIACAVVTVAGAVAAAGAVVVDVAVPSWATVAAAGLLLPAVAGAVVIRWTYWLQIANSVEVTDRQLPELYEIYVDLVARIGLDYIPRLYVANGNGALNAFASKCRIRRGYVVVYSDLIDIAHEHGDLETVRFVLAHELAHIRCGHVDLWRMAITALPRLCRLDRSLVRAQEYTADRTAAFLAPEGARGMMALFAGKRLYRHIDFDAYIESVLDHDDGIWLRLVNVWSDHAVGFRRLTALANATHQPNGWDTHGRML